MELTDTSESLLNALEPLFTETLRMVGETVYVPWTLWVKSAKAWEGAYAAEYSNRIATEDSAPCQ